MCGGGNEFEYSNGFSEKWVSFACFGQIIVMYVRAPFVRSIGAGLIYRTASFADLCSILVFFFFGVCMFLRQSFVFEGCCFDFFHSRISAVFLYVFFFIKTDYE